MVDILSFADVTAPRARRRCFAILEKLLPRTIFALCFAFTMALVLGMI